jgi:predicted N-acyltransferase
MIELHFIEAIDQVKAAEWNSIAGNDHPFTRHEFLAALESSAVVSAKSGWQPQHLLVYRDKQLIAVMPLYLKSHSYGEYVFDWSWADAYRQNGLAYYPKLLAAIPYTPCSGPRLCLDEKESINALLNIIVPALRERCDNLDLSSFHLLFPQQPLHKALSKQQLSLRTAVHFQWFNHGFENFDHFLTSFSSRKRKNLNKERRAIVDSGISFDVFTGAEMTEELWERFYLFYQITYAKRSGHGGYFNQAFFQQIAKTMPEKLVMVMAKMDDEYVAGALNFRDSEKLYGRYWGCIKEIDYLHFETCYYQGIEYCIQHGLKSFDPGVQGEHKLARGFEPVFTYSNHYLCDTKFQSAVDDFLLREEKSIRAYFDDCRSRLPFKQN